MSTVYNLSLIAGETPTFVVSVVDQLGVAIDLTGAKAYYTAALPIPIVKTDGAGTAITDPVNGEFEIAFLQADTEYIDSVLEVHHECKLLTATGVVLVAFSGYLVVNDSLIETIP